MERIKLDSIITIDNLEPYLEARFPLESEDYFQNNVGEWVLQIPMFVNSICHEFQLFGVKTLQDLDDLIESVEIDYVKMCHQEIYGEDASILGLLRELMVAEDPRRYYETIWAKDYGLRKEDLELYRRFHPDGEFEEELMALYQEQGYGDEDEDNDDEFDYDDFEDAFLLDDDEDEE